MAKIVILAANEDKDAISEALEGFDFSIVEPTASNLLHIVIGMVDEAPEEIEKSEKSEEDDEDVSVEEPVDEVPLVPEVEESLGFVYIDDELVEAFKGKGDTSILHVTKLISGVRSSYNINESVFSLWPKDVDNLKQSVHIRDRQQAQIDLYHEVKIVESKSNKCKFFIGLDLMRSYKR